jgi:four helix bundle protein
MTMRHEQRLFIHIHSMARKYFPADERFELQSQIRRAAYSVVANIVEGVAREHVGERSQFLNVAWGSLAEVGYCLHDPRDLRDLSRTLKVAISCLSPREQLPRGTASLQLRLHSARNGGTRERTSP